MTDFTPDEIAAMAAEAERMSPSRRGYARMDLRTTIALPELGMVGDILDGADLNLSDEEALKASVRSALEGHGLTVSVDSKRRAKPMDFIVGRIGIVARVGEGRFLTHQTAMEYAGLPQVIGLVFVSPFAFAGNGALRLSTPIRFVQARKADMEPEIESKVVDVRRRSGRATAERMLKRAFVSKIDVEVVEVDNPYWTPAHAKDRTNPRKITAVRNANESPIAMLEARGAITPAQAAAALKFRRLYERVMAGTPSPGEIKERVDGGGRPDAMTDARMQAGRELMQAAQVLGAGGYWLVRAVCGDGHSIRELARRVAIRRPSAVAALRWALDTLAETWNLASKGTPTKATIDAR